jgi:hypothetical protein
MVSLTHGEGNGRQTIPVQQEAWITEAVRLGYWLTEETLRRKGSARLFGFVSSPTLSCLPGLVLLGCILRNRLSVSNQDGQDAEQQRRTLHFLHLWEAGEGSELSGPNGRTYRIVNLREEDSYQRPQYQHLKPGQFREDPDLIHALARYEVLIRKGRVENGPQWVITTKNCLGYSLGKTQTAYERILEDLREVAGLPATNETHLRIPLLLAGPSRKNLTTLYVRDMQISRDTVGPRLTLNELLNLDTTGRHINPHYWNEGAWLNPKARRQRERPLSVATRGVAVIDGPAAWQRWSEMLQKSTRVLFFHRTSSNLRYERTRTILNQVHANLGPALVYEGHTWFKEFNPIRAFVHEWQ